MHKLIKITKLKDLGKAVLSTRILHAYRMLLHTTLFPFEKEIRVIRRFLRSDYIAVDVGANVGLYTTILARHASRVIAFEPNPSCAQYLFKLNMNRCTIIQAALSDCDGKEKLRIPYDEHGFHHAYGTISEQNNFDKSFYGNMEVLVETVRLDTAMVNLLSAKEKIGFIKIDVEGKEFEVLKGATKTLDIHRPVILLEIEVRHGGDIEGVFSFLAAYGYRPYALLSGDVLSSIDSQQLVELQSKTYSSKDSITQRHGYVNNVFFLLDEFL